MKRACIALLPVLALLARCPAEDANVTAPVKGAVVTMEYSNPALSPSSWKLTLHPDGSGHFTSQMATVPTGAQSEMRLPNLDRDVRLSPKFADSVFATARRHDWFNEECDSHMKVAFSGWKSLRYVGPEGQGSCTFNYSKDKQIERLGNSFMAVAQTIFSGARLEMLLQHDPLGLNKEIDSLALAAQDGRAQQICTIRSILERLAQDGRVMDLVRKQARNLLAHSDI